jgi:hypothetical protein
MLGSGRREVGNEDCSGVEQNERRNQIVRRFLFVAVLLIVLLAAWNGFGVSANKSGPTLIKEFILSPQSKGLVNEDGQHPSAPIRFKTLASEENLAKHDHFKWRYDRHYVTLYSGETHSFLQFQVKEYQEFISPDSRGFVLWTFFDYEMDGKFDSVKRSYYLVMQDRVVMMPEFPAGYINIHWYEVPTKEAKRRFQKEVNYWLGVAKK